jgi:hypothetical protein
VTQLSSKQTRAYERTCKLPWADTLSAKALALVRLGGDSQSPVHYPAHVKRWEAMRRLVPA